MKSLGWALGAVIAASCGRVNFDPRFDAGDDGTSGSLAIAPLAPAMNLSSALTFSATGGTPPYTFSITSGRGALDAVTGDFFSPTARGTATIAATDRAGQIASTTVSFGGAQVFVLGGTDGGVTRLTTVRTTSDGVTWADLTPGLPAARDSGAAVVFRDAIYYIGGDNGSATATVWRSTDGATFQSIGTLPTSMMSMSAVVYNQEIWLFGGYNGADLASVFASPDGVTWTAKSNLPTARHESAAFAHDDLYVIGGHDGTGFLRNVEKFDPLAGAWSTVGMTNVTVDFQSGAEAGGFLLHGSGAGSVALSRSTDFLTWSACAPLSIPIEHPGIVDLNGEILVIGMDTVHHSTNCAAWTTTPYPETLQRTVAVQFTP